MSDTHPYTDTDSNRSADLDLDVDPTTLEYGDELTVSYEKVQTAGSWSLEVEVTDVRECDGFHGFDIDVQEQDDHSKYTLSVSEYGASVFTNYPNPDDNQQIGTDATVDRPDQDDLQNTGRELSEHIVFVRVDETPVTNDRVAVHVEHPDHDGGVRCFYRHAESVGRTIRSHIDNEIDADLERVALEDTVGLELTASEILPAEYRMSGPAGLETPEVLLA